MLPWFICVKAHCSCLWSVEHQCIYMHRVFLDNSSNVLVGISCLSSSYPARHYPWIHTDSVMQTGLVSETCRNVKQKHVLCLIIWISLFDTSILINSILDRKPGLCWMRFSWTINVERPFGPWLSVFYESQCFMNSLWGFAVLPNIRCVSVELKKNRNNTLYCK